MKVTEMWDTWDSLKMYSQYQLLENNSYCLHLHELRVYTPMDGYLNVYSTIAPM